jgi:hypothetical protein
LVLLFSFQCILRDISKNPIKHIPIKYIPIKNFPIRREDEMQQIYCKPAAGKFGLIKIRRKSQEKKI